ncbi:hypothetical protein Pyn_08947 [Prunus yedoensis var. nudiflora]|uniref:FLZ-type domain-containing protein n=1 Tax=Prunus yedoensis var. nudiflora TaxID=2094558 RepID=A0A314YN33_PRUYE|nr:hypothetical protein Pyn_08947 [Prunus yedoensis var. nudiflora]
MASNGASLRSSSQGETGCTPFSLFSRLCVWGNRAAERPQRPTIKQLEKQPSLSISREQPDEGFRAFLKCCSLCKKQLKQDGDVYMYGYLTAYCSPDCRDDQMALDGFDKKIAADREIRKIEVFGKPNAPLH